MDPESLDLPTALALLELDGIPDDFEDLARKVVKNHPAADALSDAQSMAYRVVWEAVEKRIQQRTGANP